LRTGKGARIEEHYTALKSTSEGHGETGRIFDFSVITYYLPRTILLATILCTSKKEVKFYTRSPTCKENIRFKRVRVDAIWHQKLTNPPIINQATK